MPRSARVHYIQLTFLNQYEYDDDGLDVDAYTREYHVLGTSDICIFISFLAGV